jgi:hypothetical protein
MSPEEVEKLYGITIPATKAQNAKDDKGKLKLSLVPTQIIRDIAQVREYGCEKYHDPDNWKQVEMQRYIDAFYRHWLKVIENPNSIDEESGIPHYKHCACNLAFICEMMKDQVVTDGSGRTDPK